MRGRIGWSPLIAFILAGCCAPGGPLVRVPPAPDIEAARKENSVIWYTSLRRETAAKLMEAFRRASGIDVRGFHGSDAALKSRFVGEWTGKKAGADLLQLTDPGMFADLKARGLLRRADTPNLLKVPRWLRDSGGFWVASHVVTAVLAYRPDRLKPGSVPRSWSALADARFRNRLIVPDPAESGPAFYWAAAMVRLHGWNFLEALGRNAAAVLPYREAAGRLAAGQAWVSGGLSGEDVWRAGRAGRPVALGIPAEGVPAIPAAAALPEGALHPIAGAAFLDFLLSPPAQRILASDGFYPALPDVRAPAGRTALNRLRLLQLPWERTARSGEKFRRRLGRSLRAAARSGAMFPESPGVAGAPRPAGRRALAHPVEPVPAGLVRGGAHPCGGFGFLTAGLQPFRVSFRSR